MSHMISRKCDQCGFELWLPLFESEILSVGLYSDSRFPGRLIVRMNTHYEDLTEVPEFLRNQFVNDLLEISQKLKIVMSAEKINIAFLGNAVRHVHAHLIPRYTTDPLPEKSPWDDPRARIPLEKNIEKSLTSQLRVAFSEVL